MAASHGDPSWAKPPPHTPDPCLVERLRAALAMGPPLRLAILFGSMARGQVRPDSDVDVAILPEDPDLPLSAELSLQVELSRATGREVDLVRLDHAPTLVKWQVARDGLLLLASDPKALPRFLASAAGEYLDFQPAFAVAAARFRRRLAALRRPPA